MLVAASFPQLVWRAMTSLAVSARDVAEVDEGVVSTVDDLVKASKEARVFALHGMRCSVCGLPSTIAV